MNFFGFSLLILSICIILGQSKPAQYKPHALPKKCIDAHDCKSGYTCIFIKKLGFKLCARFKHNLGPQEGGPVQEGSFRSAKKSRKQSKLPPSVQLSAPSVAEELSSGIKGKDYLEEDGPNGTPLKGVATPPPSPKTEDDYLEDDFLEDADYEPDDTDDDQEFPEEDNYDPEVPEEDNSVLEENNSDPEVNDEEGDPEGEEPEIQENGINFFIYKGAMVLVVILPHQG